MVKIKDNILKLIALLSMKVLEIFNKFRTKKQYLNLYTIWMFEAYEDGSKKSIVYFTDKTGSSIIDIPTEELKRMIEQAEPPAKSIIE